MLDGMPSDPLQLPDDFGHRVRAARGYARGISQKELASRIGMSEGYVKGIEKGEKGLKDPEQRGLLALLPSATGLPQAFFLGEPPGLDRQLAAIEDRLEALPVETAARVLEAIRRRGEGLGPDEAAQ